MTRPALTVSIASQRPTATWISEPAWDARYLRTISIEFEEDDCLYDYALYDQYTRLDGDLPTPRYQLLGGHEIFCRTHGYRHRHQGSNSSILILRLTRSSSAPTARSTSVSQLTRHLCRENEVPTWGHSPDNPLTPYLLRRFPCPCRPALRRSPCMGCPIVSLR